MKIVITALEAIEVEESNLQIKLEYLANNIPDEDIITLKIADPGLMYAELIMELDKVLTRKRGVKLKALNQKKVTKFFKEILQQKQKRLEF